jgi:glutathione S-transferase
MLAQHQLTYFGFAGRGQSIRWAFLIGKIPFTDTVVDFATFGQQKSAGMFPLGSVPALDVDVGGVRTRFCESNALTRYAGKLAGLYPHDPIEALRCDELLDAAEDLFASISNSFSLPLAEKVAARQAAIAPTGAFYKVFAMIVRRYDENFARTQAAGRMVGRSLTIADLKIAGIYVGLLSGMFDGIPSRWVTETFPSFGIEKMLADIEAAAKQD